MTFHIHVLLTSAALVWRDRQCGATDREWTAVLAVHAAPGSQRFADDGHAATQYGIPGSPYEHTKVAFETV